MTFVSDLSKVRITRQKKTNKALAELLCHTEGLEDSDLKPYLNFKAFDRLADLYDTDREDLYCKCAGNYDYALAVANGCAIKSSRQGSTDERYVLEEIDKVTKGFGIYIKPLNNQDLRPTKDGRLLTKQQFKELREQGLTKLDCLKSLDGVISGEKTGYIFAKIVFGEGGHQDNVFHEAAQFGDWANEYGDKDKVYVLLIDTNLDKKYNLLKEKYDSDNVWVVNHIELQNRLGISS